MLRYAARQHRKTSLAVVRPSTSARAAAVPNHITHPGPAGPILLSVMLPAAPALLPPVNV